MPNGRFPRRTMPRLARGFAIVLVSLIAGTGCQRFPLRYASIAPQSTSRPTTRVEPTATDSHPPGELPPLDATPLTDATPLSAPSADQVASSPTPLIDEALKKAEIVQVAPADETPTAPVAPDFAHADLANDPVELPAAREPAPVTVVDPAPDSKTSIPKVDKDAVAPRPIKADKPTASIDEWHDGLTRVRQVALRRAGEAGDAAEAWAIRSRVLDWLAGEGPEPAGQTGQVWNSVLATLATATGAETPDDATLSHHLGAAVDALEAFSPLQIHALSFCRKIDGFGHYEPIDTPAVRPGQALLVYCEMLGLRYETDKDQFRSRLSSQVEVLPASGGAVVWSEALGTAEDVCRRRRRDYFVNYRFIVPARLTPGSYSLRLSQTDMLSKREVSATLPFTVKP